MNHYNFNFLIDLWISAWICCIVSQKRFFIFWFLISHLKLSYRVDCKLRIQERLWCLRCSHECLNTFFFLLIIGCFWSNTTLNLRGLPPFIASINTDTGRLRSWRKYKSFFALSYFMLLSSYFIVADSQTASLQIMLNNIALTSCTTAVDFETVFDDTHPFKRDTLMIFISDADGTAIFCAFLSQHNTQRYLVTLTLTLTLTLTINLEYAIYISRCLSITSFIYRWHV